MLCADYKKHTFKFNAPSGTSRGVLTEKTSYFLSIFNKTTPQIKGLGEVSLIKGLSPEGEIEVENLLNELKADTNKFLSTKTIEKYPAVKFGIETALNDLQNGGNGILFPSDFTSGKKGIKINGLVWMGTKSEMYERIKEKVNLGFTCIKIKIGAINFDDEIGLLKYIRSNFSKSDIEIRVDANGAFLPHEALYKLNKLSKLNLHSIEQPIKPGQWSEMANICKASPLPVALDEELIGIADKETQNLLLESIKPHYIVLKPSLVGGLKNTENWSNLAKKQNIDWWVTSALEGNIGLSAIAQWTFVNGSKMPQGLGTGQLFSNNTPSPLEINGEKLWYNPSKK